MRQLGDRGRLLFGGDYNPEQWPEEVWHEDIRLMKQAKVTTATIGVFSWSSIEPEEGRYEFGWLDRVIELLSSNGIGVILATPTASPPPWFTRAHPEAMPVPGSGVRLAHGSRDTYNPAAPAYREACRRVARALGERYGTHPALQAWHVHNEYGSVSYGPVVDQEFRRWLRERYQDLPSLNTAWNTAFWSQGYSDWDEILAPQQTQYLPNPTQVLDFKRFSASLLLDCYRDQLHILRDLSPDVPLTTNFILPTWLHYDQWEFSEESDFVSIDHYIDAPGAEGAAFAAYGADLARSFGHGRPWLLMEQAANTTSRDGRMLAKEPGQVRTTSLQHVARGSLGALFFQWRAPLTGAEFFHSTMVPHVGENSRTFREVTELGELLERLGELAQEPNGPVNRPQVAIVWDADAWWSAETSHLPSDAFDFQKSVRRVHRALWFLGINSDFVRVSDDLSRYRLVLIPSKLTFSPAESSAFAEYVRSGGHAVVWYFSGSLDHELHVIAGGYSGAIAETLGIRVEELLPLERGQSVTLDSGATAEEWTELVQPRGADIVSRYDSGPLAGEPAVTANLFGEGRAYYVSTELDEAALQGFLAPILAEAGVAADAAGAGAGLEAVRRYAGDASYLFLFNHGDQDRRVTAKGVDVLSGEAHTGELVIAADGFVVLRETTAP